MRKANFATSHTEFETWIMWYGNFLRRLIEAQRIVRTKGEKLELVEALVLRCAVRWEVLVQEDIITSLNRDSSGYASALGLRLRKHLSRDECKAMLVGHRYLDFRSVADIKRFGKNYLSSAHNPFRAISSQCAEKIDEFMTMRNVLAHYSDFAWRSYHRFMQSKYNYKRVPEPGEFLIRPNTRSHEYRGSEYLRAFLQCSEDMRAAVSCR